MIPLLLIYTAVAWFNIPGLLRQKAWGELAAFSFFFAAAFILGLLYVLDIPVPNPMRGLQYIISDLWGLKYPEP